MYRITIKVPANFSTFRAGFSCPHCHQEADMTLKGKKPCHKVRCPSCSKDIMVHVVRKVNPSGAARLTAQATTS